MSDLSLQGKIYVVCQLIYFVMMSFGLYELQKLRKTISSNLKQDGNK